MIVAHEVLAHPEALALEPSRPDQERGRARLVRHLHRGRRDLRILRNRYHHDRDQAGEETSFTTFGSNVDLHANGFEVESYVPGGDRMPMSGTSMSSPNVVNLAAKLLARNPSLSVAELREKMIAGSDQLDGGRRVLINPRATIAGK